MVKSMTWLKFCLCPSLSSRKGVEGEAYSIVDYYSINEIRERKFKLFFSMFPYFLPSFNKYFKLSQIWILIIFMICFLLLTFYILIENIYNDDAKKLLNALTTKWGKSDNWLPKRAAC